MIKPTSEYGEAAKVAGFIILILLALPVIVCVSTIWGLFTLLLYALVIAIGITGIALYFPTLGYSMKIVPRVATIILKLSIFNILK